MKEDSIPISDLRQYSFCPRIPWFHSNFSFLKNPTKWMKQGEEYHTNREKLLKKRLLRRFQNTDVNILFNIPVQSIKYKIHGIIDAVLETKDGVYPIEFKMQKGSITRGIRYQMVGYAICLEELKRKEVNMGYLIYGKNARVEEIFITIKDKEKVIDLISTLYLTINKSILPDSPASILKCSQCEYLIFCNDRSI